MPRRRNPDAKPRDRSEPPAPTPVSSRRTARELRALRNQARVEHGYGSSGMFISADRSRSGRKTGIVVGVLPAANGLLPNPAVRASHLIRQMLTTQRPRPMVTIYDADGKAIALYNPHTKIRTPLV